MDIDLHQLQWSTTSIPGSLFVRVTANALEVLAAALLGAPGLCYSSAVSVRGHLTTLPLSHSVHAVYLHQRCTCACIQKRCKPRQMKEDASEQS
ncbi:hypothetical protein HZ326_2614 [Fusarium oxysporum f. sp. albedinis]|nr:hypothetical protein HZ326_2614 [Fusarium oxysporum f. sp. albedinis]